MSQDPEKYIYFTVGLLKNSFALEALRRDTLKYHMVDQPDQLIALRLTEYYELMAGGILPPSIGVSHATTSTGNGNGNGNGRKALTSLANIPGSHGTGPVAGDAGTPPADEESVVAASPDAEQNADEAAEYWSQW
jgi:hypothetical protein